MIGLYDAPYMIQCINFLILIPKYSDQSAYKSSKHDPEICNKRGSRHPYKLIFPSVVYASNILSQKTIHSFSKANVAYFSNNTR